jgi:TldD protein
MLEYFDGKFITDSFENIKRGVSLYTLKAINKKTKLLKSFSMALDGYEGKNVRDLLLYQGKISRVIVPSYYSYSKYTPHKSKYMDFAKRTSSCNKFEFLKNIAKDVLGRINHVKRLYLLYRGIFRVKHILLSHGVEIIIRENLWGLSCVLVLKISGRYMVILSSNAYTDEPLVDELVQKITSEVIDVAHMKKITSLSRVNTKLTLLSPDTYGTLIHEGVLHHLEADNYAKELIVSNPMKNTKTSAEITILDLPYMKEGIKIPIDDEGVEKRPVMLLNKGIISGRLHNTITASEFNECPTGNGRAQEFYHLPIPRQTNLLIQSERTTLLSSIIENIKEGLYVTNAYKGIWDLDHNFEVYCCGAFLIKDGEITSEFIPDLKLIGRSEAVINKTLMMSRERKVQTHFFMGCNKQDQQIPVSIASPYAILHSLRLQHANYALDHILNIKKQINSFYSDNQKNRGRFFG